MGGLRRGEPVRCPFTILVHEREQPAYTFAGLRAEQSQGGGDLLVTTKRAAIPMGDYSILDYERMVCVERMTSADMACTLTKGRKEFRERMKRLGNYDVAWIVVEAELSDLGRGHPLWDEILPKSVYRAVSTWQLRYPAVRWWACAGQAVAEGVTFQLLATWWRERVEMPRRAASRREAHERAQWAQDVPAPKKKGLRD